MPVDFVRLHEDLRAVCTRHGLRPPAGEEVYGWVTLVGAVGHFADGREYTRVYCLATPGLDLSDEERLLAQRQEMLSGELSLHSTG